MSFFYFNFSNTSLYLSVFTSDAAVPTACHCGDEGAPGRVGITVQWLSTIIPTQHVNALIFSSS